MLNVRGIVADGLVLAGLGACFIALLLSQSPQRSVGAFTGTMEQLMNLSAGESRLIEMAFRNDFGQPIRILNVSAGCGSNCELFLVDYEGNEIKSHSTAKVRLRIHVTDAGEFSTGGTVFVDTGRLERVPFELSGTAN